MTKRHIPIILIQKMHVKPSYRKMQSPTPTKNISKPPPLSLWGIDSIPVLSFTHFSLPSSITDAPCTLWLLFFLMPLIVSEGAKERDHQFRHQSMCHLFLCLKSRHVIKREVFFSWKKTKPWPDDPPLQMLRKIRDEQYIAVLIWVCRHASHTYRNRDVLWVF